MISSAPAGSGAPWRPWAPKTCAEQHPTALESLRGVQGQAEVEVAELAGRWGGLLGGSSWLQVCGIGRGALMHLWDPPNYLPSSQQCLILHARILACPQVARILWQLHASQDLLRRIQRQEGRFADGSLPVRPRALSALVASLRNADGPPSMLARVQPGKPAPLAAAGMSAPQNLKPPAPAPWPSSAPAPCRP